jgi:REP element-mobilizing transposase RayT
MPSKKLKTPVCPDRYYHIYNRGNNKEKMFYHSVDYYFFLSKYKEYVAPFVETYAFCLLPNHFHFLLKTGNEINQSITNVPNQLRKLFICHAQRINFMHQRMGGLFTKSYQRIEVQDEAYLTQLVNYIHKNPIKHGVHADYETYLYSSYRILVCESKTLLARDDVFDWFGGKQQFLDYHSNDQLDHKTYSIFNIDEDEAKT